MSLIGCLNQYIVRCIGQYIDRPSTNMRPTCRSTVDRQLTDVLVTELPLMSAEVSTVTISGAYRSTAGGISVTYQWNVSRVSFDCQARVYRYYVPIHRPILSINISIYTRYYLPIYRPVQDTIYRYHRPMYRPMYRPIY